MTYGGRTFEQSYSTFEDYFGPVYYSFNKGKAHYIVLDNCFYVNRNYQYIGYIDERTFSWGHQTIKWGSYAIATAMLLTVDYADGQTFSLYHSNIIILLLANMAFWGTLVYVFTMDWF